MAKEMMIVFVYDTLACTSEEDDPADAVLYFHPGWVSDQQRHALAGQVVGTAHCVKSLFSQPLAITLQSGKFIIREYGRLILAIGSDRNIPDWVLNNRAQLLTSLISVHHGDLSTVGRADRLYQMFETYLPMLQYGRHIFQRVPMLNLPKSETSVYLEAMQILEYCRRTKGVLGGIIVYNNKIVATQLPPGLTSYLTVVDPYRIKSPAEAITTSAPLPLGSQLLAVYLQPKTYENLRKEASAVQEFADDAEDLVGRFRKNQESEREKQREFPTGMKRDKSLLFTAVPEEDHTMISPPSHSDTRPESDRKHPNIPDVVPFTNRPRPRPTKLSLSFKNQQSLDEDVKEDKIFTGQTSVCSTPMVEYKRLHGNVISICQNPESQKGDTEPDVLRNTETKEVIEQEKKESRMSLEFNCVGDHYINKPSSMRKLNSVMDIQESIKRISNRAVSKFKSKETRDDTSPSPERIKKTVSTMTINDPSFPVFRDDGKEISESLFKQYLEQHYSEMKRDSSKDDNLFTFNMKLENKFEDFDSEIKKSPQRTPKKVKEAIKIDQSRRKSLSLPLKSLSESSDSQINSDSDAVSFKKKLSGVQLTPLMEKLSHLAFSDKSSGYSSRVMTPLEIRDFATPAAEKQVTFTEKSKRQPDAIDECEVPLELLPTYSSHAVKCALFVSGLQNMALLAVMDIEAVNDADAINSLWETSLNCLGSIEEKCMEPFPTTEAVDYSYLTLDPEWGTVKTGGRWASLDIATMGLIHTEFADDPQLEELVLRSDDSVVLGASCGRAQVYYQENGTRQAGVPAPSDALATAPLRAKRRLHRDHAIVML